MKVLTCYKEEEEEQAMRNLREDVITDEGVIGSHHLETLNAIALKID